MAKNALVLPASAMTACDEPMHKHGEPWSTTHAACFVNCPIAMVRLALRREGSTALKKRALRMSRLPLHYAATRSGYRAIIPVGPISEGIQNISEQSAVLEILKMCPQAAHITYSNGQLPLHIAIDMTGAPGICDWNSIQGLLSQYPDSLECPDGKTKLFPFMHAAVGKQACVDAIFLLLLLNPALLSS